MNGGVSTASTFSHSKYQLPITKVIEVELPYSSSITEVEVLPRVMHNKTTGGRLLQVLRSACCNTLLSFNKRRRHTHTRRHTRTHLYFTCNNMNTQSHKSPHDTLPRAPQLFSDRSRHIHPRISITPAPR